jgi:hypothetical protein
MDTHSAPLAEWITAAERYAAALDENRDAEEVGLRPPYGEPALTCLRAVVVVGFRRLLDTGIDLSWLGDQDDPGPPVLLSSG